MTFNKNIGSFSHLNFPIAKTKECWYTPLRAAINKNQCFIKEYHHHHNEEMIFNQDGRPDELYFGFEDILKHNTIWNDKLFLKELKKWTKLYDTITMSYNENENPPNLLEIIMDKIIWKHISSCLFVDCVIKSSPDDCVDILITVFPTYSDKFEEVKEWIKSLHIPFNLKQILAKRLIKRRSLDLFMILKNEMTTFGLLAKMPSINQESIVIEQIMKAIDDFSSSYDYEEIFDDFDDPSSSSLCVNDPDDNNAYREQIMTYSYFIKLKIWKDIYNENDTECYKYHFSDIKVCNQSITLEHEIIIDTEIL